MMSIPVALTRDSSPGTTTEYTKGNVHHNTKSQVHKSCGLPLCEMSVKKYLGRNPFMKGLGMLVISLTLQTEVSLLHGF